MKRKNVRGVFPSQWVLIEAVQAYTYDIDLDGIIGLDFLQKIKTLTNLDQLIIEFEK